MFNGANDKPLPPHTWPELLGRAAIFALLYVAGAVFGDALSFRDEEISAFWAPSGLMLGALLLHRPRQWPVLYLAAVLASVFFETFWQDRGPVAGLAFATGIFLQGCFGAGMVRRWAGTIDLSRVGHVLLLTAIAFIAPAVSATVSFVVAAWFLPDLATPTSWLLWWSADVLGVLLVTPVTLAWMSPQPVPASRRRVVRFAEASLMLVLLAAIADITFGPSAIPTFSPVALPFPYLAFPLLLFSAMRLGICSTAIASLLLASIAIWNTSLGYGPFQRVGASQLQATFLLELFVVVSHLFALLPTALMARWRAADDEIQSLNATLEQRVVQRTAELAESRSLYQTLTSVSPVGIFRTDAAGRCSYVNERWAEITGVRFEDALGDSWVNAMHPEDQPGTLQGWERALAERTHRYQVELRCLKPGGESVWIFCQMIAELQGDGIAGYIGSITDITERKRMEEELRDAHRQLEARVAERTHSLQIVNEKLQRVFAARERMAAELAERESILRSFFESAPMMMGVVEMTDGDDNMLHISVNPATSSLMGIPASEMANRTAVELGISRTRMEMWAHHYRKSERLGAPVRFEYGYETENGPRRLAVIVSFIARAGGERSRFSYVAEDVTDRETARQAFQRLAAILEATPDFVATTDRTGKVTFLNRAARAAIGLGEEEETGDAKIFDYHPQWTRELLRHEAIPVALLGGSWRGETALLDRDGVEVPVSQIVLAHKDARGHVEFFSTVIRDMSEQKAVAESMQASLAEKEILLREIHHRVKNNMQIVSSLLQLQSSYVKDREALAVFEECRERIRSMALIHEHLYQSNDLAKINFREYLRNLLAMVFSAHRTSSMRVDTRLHVDEISLDLDTAIPVGLIVNELVTNSLKYAFTNRESGVLSVELRNGNGNGEGRAGRCTLTVCDNGVGFQGDASCTTVSTLGLRLVGLLARQIGGEVECSCENGTEFRVHFRKSQRA